MIKERVCVIDDDEIFQFVLISSLKSLNIDMKEICAYSDGDEAIHELERKKQQGHNLPEIVFLDLNMPIMNGWEFLEKLKSKNWNHSMSIYIVSSSVDPQDVERSKTFEEVTKYVAKPVTINDLNRILYT